MDPREFRCRLSNHQEMAALPLLLRDALHLPDDDPAALAAFGRRAQATPDLAAVLRDAARDLCAGYPGPSLLDAVSLLGTAGIRRSLVRGFVQSRFTQSALGNFPLESHWNAAHRRGLEAERIALFLKSPWAEHAYAAAYVQDIGRLLLALLAPERYEKVQGAVFARGLHLLEAEQAELGVDHALAGKWLAEDWGLPQAYIDAIWLHHHAPCVIEGLGHAVPLLDILAVAEHLANRSDTVELSGVSTPQWISERLGRLGIDPGQLEVWASAPVGCDEPGSVSAGTTPTSAGSVPADADAASARRQRALCTLLAHAPIAGDHSAVLAAVAAALREAFAVPAGFCYAHCLPAHAIEAALWRGDAGSIETFRSVGAAEGGQSLLGRVLEQMERRDGGGLALQDLVLLPMRWQGRSQGQIALDWGGSPVDQESLSELHRFAEACGAFLARQAAFWEAKDKSEALATALWKQEVGFRRRLQSDRLSGISQLAAGAAHEINNPLAVISGRAQILLSRTHGEEDAKALETIVRQSRRITQILTDLMQFARPAQPRYESVLLHYVIHQVLASLRERFEREGIRIVEEYAEAAPRVRIDPHQMQRVFLNVFLNAEEAMSRSRASTGRRGGTLRVYVKSIQRDSGVEVRVEDSGPGIPASIIDQVFDPFFTTKNVGEGTGLGLAVCHGIVSAHGGLISVESRVGSGAAVTVVLPAVRAHQTQNVPESVVENLDPVPVQSPGKPRLLVAEADDDLAVLLLETLRQRGFEVRTVRDGLDALASLAEAGAELLIMEEGLTGIAGEPLFEEVRERFAAVPVIVLARPNSHRDPGAYLRAGAQACLCKPFEMARLLAEVRAATTVRNVA